MDLGIPIEFEDGGTVVDLESLEAAAPAERLRADEVGPGDGRFFIVTSARQKDRQRLEAEVLANRKREAERAAGPDRVIAQRWGDASDEMKRIDADLDVCAVGLGDIEKEVSAGVMVPKAGVESQWNRWMALAETYDNLRSRWIAGDREGLGAAAASLRKNIATLSRQVVKKE